MRLITEEGFTMKQAADKIGCSVNAIQNWKAQYKNSDGVTPSFPKKAAKSAKGKKGSKKIANRYVQGNAGTAVAKGTQVAFDAFVRNFWSKHAKAAEVLLLPPEIAPEAVRYINDVLRYAYKQLHG